MTRAVQLRKEARSLEQLIEVLAKGRAITVSEAKFIMDKHGMNLCTLLERVKDAAEKREVRGD